MDLIGVRRMLEVCLWSDVTPEVQGHKGIGKTQVIEQIGKEWLDPFTKKKGIPIIVLHLATQEITDLIGFPIKIWEKSGTPVIAGIESPDGQSDRIVTSWAAPCWWPTEDAAVIKEDKKIVKEMRKKGASEDEIALFWNRPKVILFLDEARRAQRDVMQAMYPLVLNKQLHTKFLPRGSRIITADNYAGAYDVREPDEAFLSRFCHIDAEATLPAWIAWATEFKVHKKVRSFLTANPTYLEQLSSDHKNAAVKYKPMPDPRKWDMVSRVDKWGSYGVRNLPPNIQKNIKHQVIAGIVGMGAASAYGAFAATTITFEDILTGKAKIKETLIECPDDGERNKLSEKMALEIGPTMKNRKFNIKEGTRLIKFFVELDQKDRSTAMLQELFLMKNNSTVPDEWIKMLMEGTEITNILEHLLKMQNGLTTGGTI